MEIVIHNFDRLPVKVHGITCKNPIRIKKIKFQK